MDPVPPSPTCSTSEIPRNTTVADESNNDSSTENGTSLVQEPEELVVEQVKVIFDQSVNKLIETVGLQSQSNYNGDEVKSFVKVLKLTLVEELGKNKPNFTEAIKNGTVKCTGSNDLKETTTPTNDCSLEIENLDNKANPLLLEDQAESLRHFEKDTDDEDSDLDEFALKHLEKEECVGDGEARRAKNISHNSACAKKVQETDELFKDIHIPDISKELEKLREQQQNEQLESSDEEMTIQEHFKNCDVLSSTQNFENTEEQNIHEEEENVEHDEERKLAHSLLTEDDSQTFHSAEEVPFVIDSLESDDKIEEDRVTVADLYDFELENLESIDQIFESEIPDQNYDLDLDYESEKSEDETNCKEKREKEDGLTAEDEQSSDNKRTFNMFDNDLRQARQLLNGSISSDSSENENIDDHTEPIEDTQDVDISNDERVETDDDDDDDKIRAVKKRKINFLSEDDDSDEVVRNKVPSSDQTKSQSDNEVDNEKKSTKKRKRVQINSSDEEDEEEDSHNHSRKAIKKILSTNRLNRETRDAEKAERDRRKRIAEKQQLYNQICMKGSEDGSTLDQVILEKNVETNEIFVEVDPKFVKNLKPHQAEGIIFLYNCTIESLQRLKSGKLTGGCILAHSMGLGKTFQVVAFLHAIMNNQHIQHYIKRALIIVPLNVIKNWVAEFNKWFEVCDIKNTLEIYDMTIAKNLYNRIDLLAHWHQHGGIMIITTNLFTKMVLGRNMTKKQQSKELPLINRYLINPGPDVVVIDEGHLLKNDKSALNKAVSKIETPRRIILTGTPLQNNLSEYFVMVDFVKPNLLGSKKEFKNRFENPISNGQHIDSTDYDVTLMKKRVHVLHALLKDCINRCDYSVLVPYLQPKFEYVLGIALTDVQVNLYRHYLNSCSGSQSLLSDHSKLGLITNHPVLLINSYKNKESEKEDEDSLKDFVVDDDEFESDSSSGKREGKKKKELYGDDSDSEIECIYSSTGSLDAKPPIKDEMDSTSNTLLRDTKELSDDWYKVFLPKYEDESSLWTPELSGKFILLISMLEQCEMMGDKILIFSQSLASLTLIERILRIKMREVDEKYGRDLNYEELVAKTGGLSHRWVPNIDYYRIDGNVSCQIRSSIVNNFNDPSNYRARLMLVSTKAGGIGINLVGANRCIILDVSWNPAIDLQAIYRIFRYGQTKPVYVYRFTSFGTMESKIYERQIMKQSLSHRVIDEQQIQRHFKANDVSELYRFSLPEKPEDRQLPQVPKDRLLADMLLKHKDLIVNYHEHDSLLENKPEEHLTPEELHLAWEEYQREKDPPPPPPPIPQWPPYLNSNSLIDNRYYSNEEKVNIQQQRYQMMQRLTNSNLYQQYYSQYQQQQQPELVNRQVNHVNPGFYTMKSLLNRLNYLRHGGFLEKVMRKVRPSSLEKMPYNEIKQYFLQNHPQFANSPDEFKIMFLIFTAFLQNTVRRQIPQREKEESSKTSMIRNCFENLKSIRQMIISNNSCLLKASLDVDHLIENSGTLLHSGPKPPPDVITLSDEEST